MISIIIPTYNEAGNIVNLIARISSALKNHSHEIIVVDDDSPDSTWQIVQKVSQKNHHLKLLRRLKVRGLTSAFNDGIALSQGNIVGWLDADLSHPPKLLPAMIEKLGRFDAVVASRYLPGAKDSRHEFFAVSLSYWLNLLCRFLLDRSLTDFTSGYILVKKSFLSKIKLRGDYGEYFIDLMVQLKRRGAKIKEIPYVNVSRVSGQSKTGGGLWDLLVRGRKYISTLIRLWLKK